VPRGLGDVGVLKDAAAIRGAPREAATRHARGRSARRVEETLAEHIPSMVADEGSELLDISAEESTEAHGK
jgi:hypothetical protein